MIWLAWRRQRALLFVLFTLAIALSIWMVVNGDAFTTARRVCRLNTYHCPYQYSPWSIENQATAINLCLLLFPCLAGVFFGAPLVASELEHDTHRVAWTQGVSRRRWLFTHGATVAIPVLLVSISLTLLAQGWSGRAFVRLPLNLTIGHRIQPTVFAVTGLVPIGYTLFALALGALLGAAFRRVALASFVLVALYTVLAVSMVLFVRPSLAPQRFFLDDNSDSEQLVNLPAPDSWNLGYRYRFVPDSTPPKGAKLAVIADDCLMHRTGSPASNAAVGRCFASHDAQEGFYYQPASHYWNLQWGEAAIYFVGTAILIALASRRVNRFSV